MMLILYIVLYILWTICYTHSGAVAENWKLLDFETWSRPFDFWGRDMTERFFKLRIIPKRTQPTK